MPIEKPRRGAAGVNRQSAIGNRRLIEVSAGLVFRDGKLLITQRHADAHLGGLWEFPGGKRHPGESFEDCLRRELMEELGIEVGVGKLLEEVTHAYPEKTVLLKFFLCRWMRHEPQTLGCVALNWITREQLDQFAFPEADAILLGKIRGTPDFWRD